MITPYTPFRIPSRDAVAIPLNAPPPAPRTPITANCDAPENVRSDNKHVCRSEKPFATAAAPKAVPYAPTVIETLRESRNVVDSILDTQTFCRRYPKTQTRPLIG
jgi:hypothetical protein